MYKTRSDPPRRKHLEQGEPLHRLDRRRPVRERGRGGREARPAAQGARATPSTSPTPRCSSARSARCWIVLDELDLMWIPVARIWRLNERHYGALQGLNKAETAAKFGEEQVKIWRRSYDIPPPRARAETTRATRRTIRATPASPTAELPLTECLKDTVARFLPTGTRRSRRPIRRGTARAHRRARQQPARAGEVPGQHLRRRTSSS